VRIATVANRDKDYTLTPLRKATKVSLTRVRLSPTRRGEE
jgi:hypothetical protein